MRSAPTGGGVAFSWIRRDCAPAHQAYPWDTTAPETGLTSKTACACKCFTTIRSFSGLTLSNEGWVPQIRILGPGIPLRFEVHAYDSLRCICKHCAFFAIPFY